MNKKTKWGIIILVGAGIIGGGIYSQLPKKNDELAAADKVMGGNKKRGKQVLNVNAKVIKPQSLTDEFTTTGVLLPDEEVDLSFETSGKIVEINFEEMGSSSIWANSSSNWGSTNLVSISTTATTMIPSILGYVIELDIFEFSLWLFS